MSLTHYKHEPTHYEHVTSTHHKYALFHACTYLPDEHATSCAIPVPTYQRDVLTKTSVPSHTCRQVPSVVSK